LTPSSQLEAHPQEIRFTVNGIPRVVHAYPMERLLDVLRERCELTGTKEGCGEGECGSCSVLMDGVLVNTCLIPVLQAAGVHPLQQAFLECGAAQCGICTPGMILAALHLLEKNPKPDLAEIREGLSGNLCRCTGYSQIFEAVAKAAQEDR
jgi:carbon-monoxide dehydrogenase small subunit